MVDDSNKTPDASTAVNAAPRKVSVRDARDADNPLLYRLAAECLMHGSIVSADNLARLARDILAHTRWQTVAELDGTPVGYLWANLGCPEGLPRIGLAVTPEARGHGAGSALVRRADELAREAGYGALMLAVDATNETAVRLYKRLGFAETGRVQIPGGHVLVNMQREVTPPPHTTE